MPKFSRKTMLFVALALLLPFPARATTVLELGGNDLIARAHRIVHGSCVDVHSFLDDERRIVTRYTFAIVETLKGDARASISFIVPGGAYRGHVTIIPGLSSHRIGDEAILFLGPSGARSGFCFPVGLDQGVYRVRLLESGEKRVHRQLHGLHLVRGPGAGSAPLPVGAPLESFKAVVRARLRSLDGRR